MSSRCAAPGAQDELAESTAHCMSFREAGLAEKQKLF
jgi:hypothetical protein